jgi:hypothetical protein
VAGAATDSGLTRRAHHQPQRGNPATNGKMVFLCPDMQGQVLEKHRFI